MCIRDRTYTILPKAVTVSGDIRFTTESRPGSAKDALGQSGLSFDGFIGGDSYGSIRGALTSLELLDAEGNDLMPVSYTPLDVYKRQELCQRPGSLCVCWPDGWSGDKMLHALWGNPDDAGRRGALSGL